MSQQNQDEIGASAAAASPGCSYVRDDGSRCPGETADDDTLCYWHDPDANKEVDDLRARLEAWAKTGESMEGFILRYAPLQGVKLYSQKGYVLRRANLFRANLAGAGLFNIDLSGADMLKANLAGANLNEAKLLNTDLLGANLDGTRLERVEWGEMSINEQGAHKALKDGRKEEASEKFEQAEEVYRTLRQAYDGAGRHEQAGAFFRREMTMRRMLLPHYSGERLWSKIVDLFCAYGESPPRVIFTAFIINLTAAVVFWMIGINGPDGRVGFDAAAGIQENLVAFSDCIYYSIVTFTTLGYGEFTPPTMLTRHLAAGHAFIGAFMMAMFVAVFGKKMTRG